MVYCHFCACLCMVYILNVVFHGGAGLFLAWSSVCFWLHYVGPVLCGDVCLCLVHFPFLPVCGFSLSQFDVVGVSSEAFSVAALIAFFVTLMRLSGS